MSESPDQHLIDELYRQLKGDPSTNGQHHQSGERSWNNVGEIEDEKVIEKARAEKGGKFDRLWNRDLSDYGDDHSDADDGFVHKLYPYTQDEEQIKRIHARSGLSRDKSTKRADYLQRSINRARNSVNWFYDWPDEARLNFGSNGGDRSDTGGNSGAEDTDLDALDICASSVTPEEVTWLWSGRLPKGKLTIFDGDPDMGKSVVTVDIAARVSTGRDFPDGAKCEAGNVIIVNVEDGAADTIVPRLTAAGADLDRIYILSSIPDGKGGTRLLNLPDDVPLLERLIKKREAVLLIIDPVLTMLSGDANKDQDARKALMPVGHMAERTDCAVAAVRHLNKSIGLKAIQRGGGNMGLIGVARAGSFFANHPEDEALRVMAPHKSNLAEKPPALSYRIVTAAFHTTARIEWMGTVEHDADALAAGGATTPHEKTVMADAVEFLRDELSDGPMWAKQVFRDAKDAGIAEITLRRAKTTLRVKSEKIGVEGWQWELPSKEDHPHGDDYHDDVDHLQKGSSTSEENPPYVGEDDQGDQGDHHDHGCGDDHDHVLVAGPGEVGF